MGKAMHRLLQTATFLVVGMTTVGCESAPEVSAISIEGKSLLKLYTKTAVPMPTVHLRHNGEDVAGAQPTFTVQNEQVVRIDNGQLVPVGNGSTSVDITVEGNKVKESLGVLVKLVDEMDLGCRPRSCQARAGDLVNVTAELKSNGVPEFTDVAFKSESPDIVEHLGKGKFLGKKVGVGTISASIGDLVQKKKIRVTEPPPDEIILKCRRPKLTFKTHRNRGDTRPERACTVRKGKKSTLKVTVKAGGTKLPLRQPEFRSSDRSIVEMDGPIMRGRRKGTAVITAMLDGMSISLPVEVR